MYTYVRGYRGRYLFRSYCFGRSFYRAYLAYGLGFPCGVEEVEKNIETTLDPKHKPRTLNSRDN